MLLAMETHQIQHGALGLSPGKNFVAPFPPWLPPSVVVVASQPSWLRD